MVHPPVQRDNPRALIYHMIPNEDFAHYCVSHMGVARKVPGSIGFNIFPSLLKLNG